MYKTIRILGYSLVELSIVVAIISLTLGGALDLATSQSQSDKIATTEERIEYITKSLENFLITNQRLPCPAGLDSKENDSDFGVEQFTNPGIRTCNSTLYNATFPNVYGGAIPFKTLNIDNQMSFDGWDRRLLYVVYKDFTINEADNPACQAAGSGCFAYSSIDTGLGQQSIVIKDANDVNIMTDAIFILVSHGEDGYGAYNRAGKKTGIASFHNNNDRENAEPYNNSGLEEFDNIFTEKASSSNFDDKIYKVSKEQLLTNANAIVDDSNSVCNNAREVVNNPVSNSVCQNAANINICTAIATKIYNLCLNFPY